MAENSETEPSKFTSKAAELLRLDLGEVREEAAVTKSVSIAMKVYGVLLIVLGVAVIPVTLMLGYSVLHLIQDPANTYDDTTLIIYAIEILTAGAICAVSIVFGINLLRSQRRHARRWAEVLIVLHVGIILCTIMLVGFQDLTNVVSLAYIAFLVLVMTHLDPSLSQERALQRKLRQMDDRQRAEEGTLGRDETGKGFIALDFFNLFWIFVVASVVGLVIEDIYHFYLFGNYEDRAGFLYGPFSPIYGVGAVLLTIVLNRFHDKNIVLVFLVSAVVGGAFEYFVSWFMQFAFGAVAWDYTGTWLSIDGRTNGFYMCCWGALGTLWIKLILPWLLRLINRIPWNWRYGVTTVCAALMFVNAAMTLMSLDCWYQRLADQPSENAMEQFFAEHYDNDYMANRFQSMSLDPSISTRTK